MRARLLPLLVVAAVTCGGIAAATHSGASSSRIAFVVVRQGFGEIWTMRSDGTRRRRLTRRAPAHTDASGNQEPAWSPDGTQIAFVTDRDHNGRCLFEDCVGY